MKLTISIASQSLVLPLITLARKSIMYFDIYGATFFFFFFSYQKVWVHGVRMVIRLEGIEDFFFFFKIIIYKKR